MNERRALEIIQRTIDEFRNYGQKDDIDEEEIEALVVAAIVLRKHLELKKRKAK